MHSYVVEGTFHYIHKCSVPSEARVKLLRILKREGLDGVNFEITVYREGQKPVVEEEPAPQDEAPEQTEKVKKIRVRRK